MDFFLLEFYADEFAGTGSKYKKRARWNLEIHLLNFFYSNTLRSFKLFFYLIAY